MKDHDEIPLVYFEKRVRLGRGKGISTWYCFSECTWPQSYGDTGIRDLYVNFAPSEKAMLPNKV